MSQLADREAIRDKLCLYIHAIDRRRWDIMPSIFHDEAVFQFGDVEGDWRGFVEQASAIINPMISTHHQIGNILFDFKGDLYGATLSVALVEYLRPELKFDGLDGLITQMDADCARAKGILANV